MIFAAINGFLEYTVVGFILVAVFLAMMVMVALAGADVLANKLMELPKWN